MQLRTVLGHLAILLKLTLVAAALALSACGATSGEGVTPTVATASSTAAATASASAKPAEVAGPMTAERLMAHVRALSAEAMGGRRAGSDGERMAADYVAEQLRQATIPALGSYLHAFDIASEPKGGAKSRNVVGIIAGRGPRKGEHVIVGAHIDHLGRTADALFPGAEDNASGVAVVLEIAASLARRAEDLDRSVVVAFFGAEEVGLLGSKHFAAHPPVDHMVAMVNIDMIGRRLLDFSALVAPKLLVGMDDSRGMGVLGTRGRPIFRALVDEACRAEGVTPWAPEDLPGPLTRLIERLSRNRGDSFPFEAVGVPALFFGQGESDDYHLPSDTADRLDPGGMAARGRAIERVVVALSQAAALPAGQQPQPGGT